MAEKSIKVDATIHADVVTHTDKSGGKIGKFYDIAAREKLDRDSKKVKTKKA